MEQGTIGDCAYIIESGSVDVFINNPEGNEQMLATRGAGTIIGEMALVDQKTRTANVRAAEDCVLVEISQEDFQRRLKGSDPIMRMVTQVILARYRDTLSRMDVFAEGQDFPSTEELERKITQSGKAVDHLKTGNEFKHAIHNNELLLHYQPILNLEDGSIAGFEALMRWNHPTRGFMPPNLFIPIAEDSGLILEATDWAIREACEALIRMEKACPAVGNESYMAVNCTAIDMLHPKFLSKLKKVTKETGVEPSRLKIEMTERLLMNNPEKVKAMLNDCRAAGFKIAIDDFGTGYSSLSYLHHYPIDTLKIDRSFVMQMTKDESALGLVKGIINLAKTLNMSLVAEGVEEKAEEGLLLDCGCDMAQGYMYSKPQAEDKMVVWLNER